MRAVLVRAVLVRAGHDRVAVDFDSPVLKSVLYSLKSQRLGDRAEARRVARLFGGMAGR